MVLLFNLCRSFIENCGNIGYNDIIRTDVLILLRKGRGCMNDMERARIPISVRSLVEYVFKAGSIDAGFQAGVAHSLAEGTKAHQQLQKQYAEGDLKEVSMQNEYLCDEQIYVIEGRCDGILFGEETVIIDEIKSTVNELSAIPDQGYPVHWAQAMCYGYIYAQEHHCEELVIQLTYVHIPTGECIRLRRPQKRKQLSAFMEDVIRQYAPYAVMLQTHERIRNESAKKITFPFPAYRAGQRNLAGAVYKTIQEAQGLFAQAPTGIGKTISTLFPSVKAMGEGLLKRIFYATAKTITRTAAEDALRLLEQRGFHMHAITITAKDKVCFKEERRCTKEYCEYANGYYDRVNAGVLDMLTHETLMSRQVIEQYAHKHCLCPFELSLDATNASDIVIGDYNYVFDPSVSLKRLQDESKRHTALLIDEAHNLVDRGREMFSAELTKSMFLQLKRVFKPINRTVYKAAHQMNQDLLTLRKQVEAGEGPVWKEAPLSVIKQAGLFVESAEACLSELIPSDEQKLLLDAYFEVQSFIRIGELFDDRYVTYAKVEQSDITLKMYCVDPSQVLSMMGKGYRAKVFFSATLSPLHYYREMLGAGENDYTIIVPSPFRREQLDVRLVPLSTRYRDRERNNDRLVQILLTLVQEQPGNYLMFFPSYAYMQMIYDAFVTKDTQVRTMIQSQAMSEDERESFLQAFQVDNEESLIGFTVLGGIFSEGIDLVGKRLNRVVVVGVGLPQIGLERDIVKQFFDNQHKNGFHYAYVYPGMNKVQQAGGRLIRSEQDEGMLVLVDDRFQTYPYHDLLPSEWK